MKAAKAPSDIPEGHHYAILIFKSESVHIPGDERSRTNPGHGYPAETRTYNTIEYTFTHNRDEWVREIEKLEKEKANTRWGKADPYAAIEVASKASIETKVVVGVKTK
jgi:hypothetical protein